MSLFIYPLQLIKYILGHLISDNKIVFILLLTYNSSPQNIKLGTAISDERLNYYIIAYYIIKKHSSNPVKLFIFAY